jgi:hypothetical protein
MNDLFSFEFYLLIECDNMRLLTLPNISFDKSNKFRLLRQVEKKLK